MLNINSFINIICFQEPCKHTLFVFVVLCHVEVVSQSDSVPELRALPHFIWCVSHNLIDPVIIAIQMCASVIEPEGIMFCFMVVDSQTAPHVVHPLGPYPWYDTSSTFFLCCFKHFVNACKDHPSEGRDKSINPRKCCVVAITSHNLTVVEV